MNRYKVEGKEVTALEKARHKLKQLNEASQLLEEISDRCAWADDFTHYQTIRDALDPVYTSALDAKDEIDEMIEQIEEQIEQMEERKNDAEIELEIELAHNIEPYLA